MFSGTAPHRTAPHCWREDIETDRGAAVSVGSECGSQYAVRLSLGLSAVGRGRPHHPRGFYIDVRSLAGGEMWANRAEPQAGADSTCGAR
jgi:hypothetical protein